MKKISIASTIIAVLISAASYAGTMGSVNTHPFGWVVGGDLGYGYLSTQEEEILAPVPLTFPPSTEVQNQNHKIGNLVGGGYLGFTFPVFNPLYMGFDVGYKYQGQSKYNSFTVDTFSSNFLANEIKTTQQAVDFLVTSKIYLWEGLNLIGRVGAAYVRSETKDLSSFNLTVFTGGLPTKATIWRIKPEFEVGIGYEFANRVGVNLMYTYIGGADSNVTGVNRYYSAVPDRLPAVFQYNALTAGLSYTFG